MSWFRLSSYFFNMMQSTSAGRSGVARAEDRAAVHQLSPQSRGTTGVRKTDLGIPCPSKSAKVVLVSVARIRLDRRKSVRPFKGIFCDDISEFESYHPRQAVRSLGASSGLQKPATQPGVRGSSTLLFRRRYANHSPFDECFIW